MLPLLRSIFGIPEETTDPGHEKALKAAIETAVDGTDPRIRMVSDYHGKLRDSVDCALRHAEQIVDAVPGPVELNRQAYSSDPHVHAFFGSADQIGEVLRDSTALKEFFEQFPASREAATCHALLAMRRNEKTVLGKGVQGDIERRDVKQILVSFSDHLVITPATSEEGARKELKERAYAELVECALERIVSMRSRRSELEKQRVLLKAKLRSSHTAAQGLGQLRGQPTTVLAERNVAERDLQRIEAELREADAEMATLDDYLEQVTEVLGQPERYLRLETMSLRLNRMGVKVAENSPQHADDLSLSEVHINETERAVLTMITFSPSELGPKRDFGAEMGQFLDRRF